MNRVVKDGLRRKGFKQDVALRAYDLVVDVKIQTSYPSLVKNRCAYTGRGRAVLRAFRASRIVVRESYRDFKLSKSSW